MASSSVSSQGSQKYDVFLNFRGEDVRHNFVSHLIPALKNESLNIFLDSKLERCEHIETALMDAIQDSKVALTIFSKGYASSSWCLDELGKIMECRESAKLKQKVLPVFYHVTPSDVRNVQSGVFAKDFAKHESDHRSSSKVPRWKAAMEAAGYLSGRIVNETSSEAHVLNQIVDDVVFLHNPKGKVEDCPNIQQQQQGLHVQEDLNKVLMSVGVQVGGQPFESHSGGLDGNNTNGCGLEGTAVPSSSVSMSNGNCGYCLDMGNGQWGYGYPVDYGNGYCDYHVDSGNGNWSYYRDRGNGSLYPYEWDVVEQAGQGGGAVTMFFRECLIDRLRIKRKMSD